MIVTDQSKGQNKKKKRSKKGNNENLSLDLIYIEYYST